jgi:phenylacetate-CoA ligase
MRLELPSYKTLIENQWSDRSELKNKQVTLLSHIISYAYENVPFYKYQFKQLGLDMSSFQVPKDLRKIPILHKYDLIKEKRQELLAKKHLKGRIREVKTSGTTGTKTSIFEDIELTKLRFKIRRRADEAIGIQLWDKKAIIEFTYPAYDPSQLGFIGRFKHNLLRIRQRYNRIFYITYGCEEIIEEIIKFRPSVIEAQPSYLESLIRVVQERDKLKLKAIITNGSLLADSVRNRIERSLEAQVYDFYGGREFGLLAWQCEERKEYHMNSDVFYLECVRDGEPCSPGERGDILVTSLFNLTMPLIRYEIGDVIVLGDNDCACGRTLPTIKSIEGRKIDFFRLPDGSTLSPKVVVNLLSEIRDIPPFQIVCTSPQDAVVKLFTKNVSETMIKELVTRLENLAKGQLNVSVTIIEEEPRAKIRPIISFENIPSRV